MEIKGLFIGLTTVDIQYFVDNHPEQNSKVKAKESPLVVAGGPAANAAVAFAALSGQADFYTCVGENAFRRVLLDDFNRMKVNIIDAMSGTVYHPIIASVLTNTSNSDRTIITHHPEAIQVYNILEKINLNDYSFVFSDGFYPELAVPVCKLAQEKGMPVIFDGGSWKPQMPDILPFVDIAICSANYTPPGCTSVNDIIQFTKKMGVKHVAISRGEKSILLDECEIDIQQVKAVDSLGAGDFLHGAFCWYYMRESEFVKSLQKASEVATFSTMYKGTRSWVNIVNEE